MRGLWIWMMAGCFVWTVPYGVSADGGTKRPNVLLIAIDDLNDWVSVLKGHPDARTPNIDRLAARGVLFTQAHCQAPICNPSRTSLMLGLRPSTTGVYENSPWFRSVPALRERVTLKQHFEAQGYETLTTGKIYHGSKVDPPSFKTVGPLPGQRLPQDQRQVTEGPGVKGLWDWGAQVYPDAEFGDYITTSWAVEQLSEEQEKPFFMAVGLYRPHVPLYAPGRLFDALPVDRVHLPNVLDEDRMDLPKSALDLVRNTTPPPHAWMKSSGAWTDVVRAYLACVHFADEQVGRLLDALDHSPHANNTIIVLLSDHGFHLGEKEIWAKRTLWERSTRVPLMISLPDGLRGVSCERPVELLSLYPTLIELCGIAARDDLDGASFAPLLKDPAAPWDHPAITTLGQNNHAVRSERWRYIRYADGAEELYDHTADPNEWHNLAPKPEHASVMAEHRKWLPKVNAKDARRE